MPFSTTYTSEPAHTCNHCGDACDGSILNTQKQAFCCQGCESVYQLLNDNNMCDFYRMREGAVSKPGTIDEARFDHLNDLDSQRRLIRKLAVAGFAFGNVMLLSFHEYLSTGGLDEPMLQATIHTLSILISTPVLGYIGLAICSRLGCDFSNDLHPARLGLRHSVFESKYRHFLPTGSCGTCLPLSQQSGKHEVLLSRKWHRARLKIY
jgi:hypothetical protein